MAETPETPEELGLVILRAELADRDEKIATLQRRVEELRLGLHVLHEATSGFLAIVGDRLTGPETARMVQVIRAATDALAREESQ